MKRLEDNRTATGAALIALIVLGAAIRWVVAGQDFFADELATYWIVSTNSLSGVVDTVSTTAEITPPLGFMLAWLGAQIDLSPEAIRLPALIAGIGSIPLVYAVGVRTVGRGAGLAAAAFVTVSPFMIFYSAEARGYGVMMAFVLLSTLALLTAIDDGRRRWWVAYGIFVALAAYTHYTSIFVLGGQFLWALWAHPRARKPLLIATVLAAIAYIPWLPSLKGDLDSPTTDILGALSPFDLTSARHYLGHWAVGFPYGNVVTLRDLPGLAGLVLVILGIVSGLISAVADLPAFRTRLRAAGSGVILVIVLACATPVMEAIQSAVSTNTFSTRNFAASWPYMALTVATLFAFSDRRLRGLAALAVLAGLSFGAFKMLTPEVQRPPFGEIAAFADEREAGVVVDDASLTPGPLANFDVNESTPDAVVLRLNNPSLTSRPFSFGDGPPPPASVARLAVRAARGSPIVLVSAEIPNAPESPRTRAFVDSLPADYELADEVTVEGFIGLRAQEFAIPESPESSSGADAG